MSSVRALRALIVTAVSVALVACGSDAEPADGDGPGATGDRNEADEVFVEVVIGSIGTLRQIVALADERRGSDEVADRAEQIEAELGEVADQLAAWADEWDLPEMISQEKGDDWERLETLDGPEFDALWVDVVSDSLAAVRSSAETVVERGQDPDVQALADQLAEDCADWTEELEELTP